MAFCYNCGNKLKENSKYCMECGVAIEETEDSIERKIEYIGNIKKCPACGEALKSLTAICPSCGHELNNKKINSNLKEFIDEINQLEKNIGSYSETRTGWSSWSNSQKTGWIILNIFFACFPLMIYYMCKLISLGKKPSLTKEENELTTVIQNYQFPNDRESILEALLFMRDKVNYLTDNGCNKKSYYWTKLWCNKAKYLKQKAEILFKNDEIVNRCYEDIIKNEELAKKKLKRKTIIVVIVVLFLFFMLLGSSSSTEKDYDNLLELPTSELVAKLPELDYTYGDVISETDDNISIEIYQIEKEDFENYVKLCRNQGFINNISKTDQVFYAKDKDGYDLSLFYYEDENTLNIHIDSYNVRK